MEIIKLKSLNFAREHSTRFSLGNFVWLALAMVQPRISRNSRMSNGLKVEADPKHSNPPFNHQSDSYYETKFNKHNLRVIIYYDECACVVSTQAPTEQHENKKMLTNESTIAQISLHISLPNSILNLWNIEIQCRHLGNDLNLSFFFAHICAVSDFNLMDRLRPQRRTRLALRSSERNSISLLKENCKSYEMEYFYWL